VAHIKEVKELSLDQLMISPEQVRVRNVDSEISELAQSIQTLGLLEPIVVCAAGKGKYAILTGQRRFLAVKHLKRKTILAAILDRKVDEARARAISLTENLMRRDLSQREKIDACTSLYQKYGSIKGVADATGLPPREVSQFVKYARLDPDLKALVDNGEVEVKVALRAQDLATRGGHVSADGAVGLARKLARMTNHQQALIVSQHAADATSSIDDVLSGTHSATRSIQVLVTLSKEVHVGLRACAQALNTTQAAVAAEIVEQGLVAKGFIHAAVPDNRMRLSQNGFRQVSGSTGA
jgi:ParB family chromosome partitioning protein